MPTNEHIDACAHEHVSDDPRKPLKCLHGGALLPDPPAALRDREALLRFIDAVSPFVRDVLDAPFPWKECGQVTTWITKAEYDEAVAALEALRD